MGVPNNFDFTGIIIVICVSLGLNVIFLLGSGIWCVRRYRRKVTTISLPQPRNDAEDKLKVLELANRQFKANDERMKKKLEEYVLQNVALKRELRQVREQSEHND